MRLSLPRLFLAGAGLALTAAACGQGAGLRLDGETAGPAMAPLAQAAAERSCAAETYRILVGQPAGEVDLASLPQPARIVAASDMDDADPARLTLTSGADGRISDVHCR